MQENSTGSVLTGRGEEKSFYRLRLFIAGSSPASMRAVTNLQRILGQHLENSFDLEIIDVHQQPSLVETEQITAVPMLIKKEPTPRRLLIGDMSDTDRVLRGLGLT